MAAKLAAAPRERTSEDTRVLRPHSRGIRCREYVATAETSNIQSLRPAGA